MRNSESDAQPKGPDPYDVFLGPHAERDLAGLSQEDERRLDKAIIRLSREPRHRGVVKIGDGLYRVRVGPWRIIFLVDDSKKNLVVSRVKRRDKDTYRRI